MTARTATATKPPPPSEGSAAGIPQGGQPIPDLGSYVGAKIAEKVLEDQVLRPATVHGAIAEVMRIMRPIPKASENKQGQSFWYRGIDAILAELHPIMASVGLVVYPYEILSTEFEQVAYGKGNTPAQACRVKVRFKMVGPDGSFDFGEMVGGSFDSGDKAVSKAITMATKSFLNNLFQIPSGDPDPDGDTYEDVQPAGRTHGRDTSYDSGRDDEPAPAPAAPTWKDRRDYAIIHGVGEIRRLLQFVKDPANDAPRLVIETIENDLAAAQLAEVNAAKADLAGQQGTPQEGTSEARQEATKSVVPDEAREPDDPQVKQAAARFVTRLNGVIKPTDGRDVNLVTLDRMVDEAWDQAEKTGALCWENVARMAAAERAKWPFDPDGPM